MKKKNNNNINRNKTKERVSTFKDIGENEKKKFESYFHIMYISIILALIGILIYYNVADKSENFNRNEEFIPKRGYLPLFNINPSYRTESEMDKYLNVHEYNPNELSELSFLHNYVRKSVPVIVRNGFKDTNAFRKWKNKTYLIEKSGNNKVMVEQSTSNIFDWYGKQFKPMEITFKNFLDRLSKQQQKNLYLTLCKGERLKELLYDIIEPIIGKVLVPADYELNDPSIPPSLYSVTFWMGQNNQISKLHFDEYENLFCMITGSKTWYLIDPTQTDYLYPKSSSSNRAIVPHSQVDILNPDYDKYPLMKHLKIYKAVLNPGDILYVPYSYWHQVMSSDEFNIGVNYWYESVSALLDRNTGYWLNQLNEYYDTK